jgi:hypothetical protein
MYENRRTIKVRTGAAQLTLDDCEPAWDDEDPDWDDDHRHFIPTDLLGQGLSPHASITDIPLTGSYL